MAVFAVEGFKSFSGEDFVELCEGLGSVGALVRASRGSMS